MSRLAHPGFCLSRVLCRGTHEHRQTSSRGRRLGMRSILSNGLVTRLFVDRCGAGPKAWPGFRIVGKRQRCDSMKEVR